SCPDVQVTKTSDVGSVSAGTSIGYTVTVKNIGTGTATGVTADDVVPTNSGLNWSIDAGNTTGSWTINGSGHLVLASTSLASGADVHAHITSPTTAGSCGTVANSSFFSATNETCDTHSSPTRRSSDLSCPDVQVTKTSD